MVLDYEIEKFEDVKLADGTIRLQVRRDYSNVRLSIIAYVNILLCTLILYRIFMLKVNSYRGILSLPDLWTIVDVAQCLLNFFVSIVILNGVGIRANNPLAGYWHYRIIVCIVSLLMWTRALYYMQLVDRLAPLVRIIFLIFNDIKYFVVMFVILLLAFGNSFYLLGKN